MMELCLNGGKNLKMAELIYIMKRDKDASLLHRRHCATNSPNKPKKFKQTFNN